MLRYGLSKLMVVAVLAATCQAANAGVIYDLDVINTTLTPPPFATVDATFDTTLGKVTFVLTPAAGYSGANFDSFAFNSSLTYTTQYSIA